MSTSLCLLLGRNWSETVIEGGVSWDFKRSAEHEIQKRVDVLVLLLRREHQGALLLAQDVL